MDDRSGIFAGDDPFAIARRWLDEASATEINDPNATALATVDEAGLPNVRVVLLKEIAADHLTFFTNYTSTKGRELLHAKVAAMNVHWKSLRRQMRFRGRVVQTSAAVSDEYFATRHPVSRLGAWASEQSKVLESRAELLARMETMRERFGDNATRPPHWGGFALFPTEIELWADGPNRLHDRFCWLYDANRREFTCQRLNP